MGLDLYHIVPVSEGEPFDAYDFLEAEEIAADPALPTRFRHLVGEEDGAWRFNYRILGYQRKGMSKQFFQDFLGTFYFEKSMVEAAFQYLTADHIGSLQERRENFKANFIDCFVEGTSVFMVSA